MKEPAAQKLCIIEEKIRQKWHDAVYRRCFDLLLQNIPQVWSEEISPRRTRLVGWEKGNFDGGTELVTEADVAASLRLLELVRSSYPFSISEEHLAYFGSTNEMWIFDPLDGTACFADPQFISRFWFKVASLLEQSSSFRSRFRMCPLPNSAEGSTLLASFSISSDEFLFPISSMVFRPAPESDAGTLWWSNLGEVHQNLFQPQEQVCSDTDGTIRIGLTPYLESLTMGMQLTEHILKLLHDYFLSSLQHTRVKRFELCPFGGAGDGIIQLLEGKIDLIIHPYRACKIWDIAPAVPLFAQSALSVTDFWGYKIEKFSAHSVEQDPRLKGGIIMTRSGSPFQSVSEYLSYAAAPLLRDLDIID